MGFDKSLYILLAIILSMIFYIDLHNFMGKKSYNEDGLYDLGVNAIKVALKVSEILPPLDSSMILSTLASTQSKNTLKNKIIHLFGPILLSF